MFDLDENVLQMIQMQISEVFREVLDNIEEDEAEELTAYELIQRLDGAFFNGLLEKRKRARAWKGL